MWAILSPWQFQLILAVLNLTHRLLEVGGHGIRSTHRFIQWMDCAHVEQLL